MKNYKGILIYIVFFSFVGCKTTEKIKEKETYEKVDTTTNNIINPTDNNLVISQLCDTLTGRAYEFTNEVVNGGNSTKITVKDNALYQEVKGDSVVYVDRVVTEVKEVIKDKKTTTYKWSKWTWIFLATTIVCFVFPFIPTFANNLVRKIIGL